VVDAGSAPAGVPPRASFTAAHFDRESVAFVPESRALEWELVAGVLQGLASWPRLRAVVQPEWELDRQEQGDVPLEPESIPPELENVPLELGNVPQQVENVPQEIENVPREIGTVLQEPEIVRRSAAVIRNLLGRNRQRVSFGRLPIADEAEARERGRDSIVGDWMPKDCDSQVYEPDPQPFGSNREIEGSASHS
jgi:hypothetical protein